MSRSVYSKELLSLKSSRRASALPSVLMVMVVVSLLAASFLATVRYNTRFSSRQESNTRAYYLARAGLEFYSGNCGLFHRQGETPSFPYRSSEEGGTPFRIHIPAGSSDYCEIFTTGTEGDYEIHVRGVVAGGSSVLATRELILENGNSRTVRDVSR